MKKAIKRFFLLLFVMVMGLMSSCSKDGNKMEFTNMSGTDFYGCDVWFWNGETSSDGAIGYEKAGNVLMGQTGKVEKLGEYCSINAKDARGNYVTSKIKKAYNGVRFNRSDLY